MTHHLLTITTDFGDAFAAAQLRAVLVGVGFGGTTIENHGVSPYSITEGAFQILTLSKYSPAHTVHLGVVDPGVGSTRKGIIIKTHRFYFIGPDNGLLYPAALHDGFIRAWRIRESHISDAVSRTFHGRDVFIKVAAHLASGKTPEELGVEKVEDIDANSLQSIAFSPGQVLHIDAYGNIKVHWPQQIDAGTTLEVSHRGSVFTFPVVNTFSDVKKGSRLALLGSSGTLELALNLGNMALQLGISVSDVLCIKSLLS